MVMFVCAPDCNWFIGVGRAILAGIRECYFAVTFACHKSNDNILNMQPIPGDFV